MPLDASEASAEDRVIWWVVVWPRFKADYLTVTDEYFPYQSSSARMLAYAPECDESDELELARVSLRTAWSMFRNNDRVQDSTAA